MSKLTSVSLIALTSLSLMLSGCEKKAEGQVVAVVNGEEITLNELNSEISDLNVPDSADKTAVRKEVLKKMVERRLLAQAAKDAGLDRDPNYISQERRLKEQLLVSMYGKKTLETVQVPDSVKIDQYISSHPAMFSSRTRYRLDQVQFDIPSDPTRLKELDSAHSMDEVVTRLKSMGINFQRGANVLDSAVVPEQMLTAIKNVPKGEPFLVRNGNRVILSVIIQEEPVLMSPDQARPIATQAIRSEELNKIGEARLAEAKAKAKIEYQEGYAPDDKAAGTPGAASNAALPAPAGNAAQPAPAAN